MARGIRDVCNRPECQVAWKTIHRILDRKTANMKKVLDKDFDSTVEETMTMVRPWRQV